MKSARENLAELNGNATLVGACSALGVEGKKESLDYFVNMFFSAWLIISYSLPYPFLVIVHSAFLRHLFLHLHVRGSFSPPNSLADITF